MFGLGMGIAACLVIVKYIDFEASYDNFHANSEKLYRVTRQTELASGEKKPPIVVTSYGLEPALVSLNLPEVNGSIRIHPMYGGCVVSYQGSGAEARAFHEKKMILADSTFLRAFTFETIISQSETALDRPNSIVITKSVAAKYFGKDDPIGKTLKLTGGWGAMAEYLVSAVIENVPGNSHFDFRIPSANSQSIFARSI
ncbi:MAG: ABC transporter permease [Cyclobacteriaceae bacterium]